ncbi:MAG: D-alanyl-D-alanine carboxypeptidase family protein [Lachnospiraceae bacterium]|nr:D-alanyl-D-alanine carboxypeptidase family protein [Lachnospiraceae bacterium]
MSILKPFAFSSFILILSLIFYPCHSIQGDELQPEELHSLSACLMDADSGRILYEKEGDVSRPNASTTKILTCILALEYGSPDDMVTISKYAASMPDVQLNVQEGEQYRLGDLLYSLMLESHNDSAVAIAEHIGGDVKTFAAMMNEKALELGCYNSHFITPNGLDASETIDGTEYIHCTTASDLCRIMAYCIQNEDFLKITQTPSYSFTNYVTGDDGNIVPGSKTYSVQNKNAFLTMMDGVLSGKTGFTGKAGYCYVTALRQDDRTYTVALLGCGWPNNKTYKWQDAKLLLNYGLEHYTKNDVFEYNKVLPSLTVSQGIYDASLQSGIHADKTPSVSLSYHSSPLVLLTRKEDTVQVDYDFPSSLQAPVHKGDVVGTITYTLNEEVILKTNIYADKSIEKFDFPFCLKAIVHRFFLF